MSIDKANPPLDIESLIAAIRREARARGDSEPFHAQTDLNLRRERDLRAGGGAGVGAAAAAGAAAHAPARVPSLREWMPYHGSAFVASAYRTLLQREPDADGLRAYSQKIAEGTLARWEVLGRMRLSGEGRARRVRVDGLWLGFALATAYRVPVVGPLAALAARVLGLPPWLRDHAHEDRLIAQLLASGR